MEQTQGINGEIVRFDVVLSTGNSDYPFLVGEVNAVNKLGSYEHETGNPTYDVYVDFQSANYSDKRIAEIEEHFSKLYRAPKNYSDIPLNNVIMSPNDLIKVPEKDIAILLESRENAEDYCDRVMETIYFDKKAELKSRIDENYFAYNDSLMSYSPEQLVGIVGSVVATDEAYIFLTEHHIFSNDELDFYLRFSNPLAIVAEAWEGDSDISNPELSYGKREELGNLMNYIMSDAGRADVRMTDYSLTQNADTTEQQISESPAKPQSKSFGEQLAEGSIILNNHDRFIVKLSAENDAYLTELKTKTPDEIIDAAYEKVCREEITLAFVNAEYSESVYVALLEIENPIDMVYMEWIRTDSVDFEALHACVKKTVERETGIKDGAKAEITEENYDAAAWHDLADREEPDEGGDYTLEERVTAELAASSAIIAEVINDSGGKIDSAFSKAISRGKEKSEAYKAKKAGEPTKTTIKNKEAKEK